MEHYPRDLHGYGAVPPDPQWPGKAQIAVQFVLNTEEGGEHNSSSTPRKAASTMFCTATPIRNTT
jgi:hypothetical protein